MTEFVATAQENNYLNRNLNFGRPQWSSGAPGEYIQNNETTRSLPSGVYRLRVNQRGEVVFVQVPIVTDRLIRFPDSATDELLLTINKFWDSYDVYKEFHQTYKRGVLLFGPQGAGKTTTLNLLFEDLLKRDGLVVAVENPEVASIALTQLRATEPNRNLILLYEDIDALFTEYGEQKVLSLLDGQLQIDRVLHLATTNYIDKIPSRLKNRPSRFDEVIEFKAPTDRHREMYLASVLNGREVDFAKWVADTDGFTIAHLKELVISVFVLEKEYTETLNRLRLMMKERYEIPNDFGFVSNVRRSGLTGTIPAVN
jgi:SpoVK/Ycf46/Vps4 family AAA+-type ATPase